MTPNNAWELHDRAIWSHGTVIVQTWFDITEPREQRPTLRICMKATDRERYATLPKYSVPAAQAAMGSSLVAMKPGLGLAPRGMYPDCDAAHAASAHDPSSTTQRAACETETISALNMIMLGLVQHTQTSL